MKRSRVVCLVLALAAVGGCGATGTEDPDPDHGSLTGSWEGWCCPRLLDTGARWYVQLVERGDGEITGTFTEVVFVSLIPGPPYVSGGTIAGRRQGSDVALTLVHAPGLQEEQFEGRQTSAVEFIGQIAEFAGQETQFTRSELDLDPGFASVPLTGRWRGRCCDSESDGPVPRFDWVLDLTEDETGGIAGTVSFTTDQYAPHETKSIGTVAGHRSGADVVLDFTYTDGERADSRARFEGRLTYPHGFIGVESTNPEHETWFARR